MLKTIYPTLPAKSIVKPVPWGRISIVYDTARDMGKGLSQLQVVTGLFSPVAEYLHEGIKKGFGIGFRLEASCWCSKNLALWRQKRR